MAQYKVPQDVEADDKLIGPFSFRQFVYLLVAGGLIALAVGMFQLFPLLAIIPIPFAFFFLALALPLKKDQPMETYLAALVSYYLKPRTRVWMPGQKESPILITAPKIVEDVRTRDISSEEATHRLSFLADIVDTEGFAIKGAGASPMREDLVAEANATPDMFETYQSQVLNRVVDQDKMSRHETAVKEMRDAITRNDSVLKVDMDEPASAGGERVISRVQQTGNMNPAATAAAVSAAVGAAGGAQVAGAGNGVQMPNGAPVGVSMGAQAEPAPMQLTTPRDKLPKLEGYGPEAILRPDVEVENSDVVIRPEVEFGDEKKVSKVRVPGGERPGEDLDVDGDGVADAAGAVGAAGAGMSGTAGAAGMANAAEKVPTNPINNSIMELANNPDFSVATIAKEANRINNRKEKGDEIFVSLH